MCEVWIVKIYLHENALIGIIYSIVIRKPKIKSTDMGLCSKSYDVVLKAIHISLNYASLY